MCQSVFKCKRLVASVLFDASAGFLTGKGQVELAAGSFCSGCSWLGFCDLESNFGVPLCVSSFSSWQDHLVRAP